MRTYCLLLALACSLQAGSIRGVVVDGETSRPLAHAAVLLQPVGGAGKAMTLRSNSLGSFEFTGLPRGAYLISASRVGFVQTEYGQKQWNGAGTPIVIEASDSFNATLRLPHYGAITGVVFDENSVGLPNQEVVAYTMAQPRQIAGRGVTDDRGVYRIGGLGPGRYLVRTKGGTFEDTFYVPTFFRETNSAEQAMQVSADLSMEARDVDIRPLAGRLYRLSGRVSGAGSRGATVTLASDIGRATVQTPDAFDFGLLAPGRYELYAVAAGDRYSQTLSGYITVDIDNRDMNVALPLGPSRFIATIQTADGEALDPRTFELRARRKDLAGTQSVQRLTPSATGGAAALAGARLGTVQMISELPAGRWELSLKPPPAYYVSGFATDRGQGSGARPDDWNEILVSGGRYVSFTISLHSGGLQGRVLDRQEPAVGVPVFLEPYDSRTSSRAGEAGMTRTDTQGRYMFLGLPPGEYRILSTREFRIPEPDLMTASRAPVVRVEAERVEAIDLGLYSSGQ